MALDPVSNRLEAPRGDRQTVSWPVALCLAVLAPLCASGLDACSSDDAAQQAAPDAIAPRADADADAGGVAPAAAGATDTWDDASVVYVDAGNDCLPGLYAGKLDCKVKVFGLFELPNGATMSLTLQQREVGSVEFPMLEIAPGGMLVSGSDVVAGMLSAQLSGQLDCRTRKVTGTLANGKYDTLLFNQTFSGDFAATYDPGPPAGLLQGTMLMKSNELPADTSCSWTATRQP
jgi:hypothetical protein